jgi:hypothetical protein
MKFLFGLIKALFPHISTQKELDEAYLNASVDIYDLERRFGEIDRRDHRFPFQQPAMNMNLR